MKSLAPTPESHLQSVKLGQLGYNQMEELPSGPSGGSNAGAEGNGSLLQLVHDHCGPCPAGSPQFMHLEVKCFIKTAMKQCRIIRTKQVEIRLVRINIIMISILTTCTNH